MENWLGLACPPMVIAPAARNASIERPPAATSSLHTIDPGTPTPHPPYPSKHQSTPPTAPPPRPRLQSIVVVLAVPDPGLLAADCEVCSLLLLESTDAPPKSEHICVANGKDSEGWQPTQMKLWWWKEDPRGREHPSNPPTSGSRELRRNEFMVRI